MITLRNILLIVLTGSYLLFLYNRIRSTKEYSIVDDLEVNFTPQPDSLRNEIALTNLVNNISTLQYLESDYVGYEGRKSTQPHYSNILAKWATINQLVKLTGHWNALVKTMAFQALRDKNYTGLKEIFKDHLNDKQTYNLHSGCVVKPVPLNIDFYSCIYPKLSSVEAASYKKELLEQYRDNYFQSMVISHPE